MARTTVARSERRRMSPMRRREELMGYLLLLPFIIGFVGLWAGPVIASFVLSFFDYNVLRGGEFIGLKNYQLMFFDDWRFWHSLRITFSYVGVVVPASVIIGYIWALALNQQVKGLSFFRTAFYMPSIVPQIASAYLFWWLLNSQVGLVNAGLDAIGIDGPDWFFSTQWALPALYIMGLWTVGGNILLYLAAFQGVPSDLYDAAKVDGANVFQRFWNVTIPLTSPVIFFTFIIGMIINLQTFTGAFVITRGGPAEATLFYILYLYKNGWEYFKMGYASGLAWILFLIIIVLTWLSFKASKGRVYYEGSLRDEGAA